MKQATIRNLHRDLGYFYLGLIITFAFSGILMNHRENWHPDKYTIEAKAIEILLPEESQINDAYAENLAKELNINDKVKRHMVRKGKFKMQFENTEVEIDLKSGKGEIIHFLKTPVISQAMKLHKSTSNWWIYFSDIFGLSLICIAVTGAMMVKHGKHTFKRRGWKLAIVGLLFPILFLLFLS
ncbi:PepSY-associated TM helix domain-containing protein [Flavobacterium sp. N2270]|uniref:PepSY-associated TM helix domain-containing protein n=1 Tax=Flavobacterium sp. N2270 TaxID=2986831 RepID=UPI00222489AD|nr:PepSY-associated TM helix domain-containing protein [Flavobacterium sp. N2270]